MAAKPRSIYAANESSVQVDGEVVDGVRGINYRYTQAREAIYALGSSERIGLVSGAQCVEGVLRVASTSAKLNGLGTEAQFQVIALLKHGDAKMTVTFDECYLTDKSFSLGAGGHAEATYGFTAVRVREEIA
jgi:hypothetical protein